MGNRSRPPRRSTRRVSLGDVTFVLPNLFTISSIFCGFYAIVLIGGAPTPQQLYHASLAIFFGIFFDMADGRIARLTRTQSEFGVQLDSLADCCTFGMAPAVLVHKWGLASWGLWGALAAFAYVSCGVIRLARFNVMAAQQVPESKKWFTGLPIPLAAGVLASLVMFYERHHDTAPFFRRTHLLVVVLALAALMVSGVRYRAFKDVALSRHSLGLFAALVAVFAALASRFGPPFALLSYSTAYVLCGLVEEVVFFGRRRREAAAQREAEDATTAADS